MLNLNAQINDVIINQDSKGMESFISAGKEFEIIFERMTMLEFQEMMISRTKGKTDSEIADISTGNMNFYEISKIFSLRVKSWRGIAINSEELKLNKKNKDLLIKFAPEFISAVMSIYLDEIMAELKKANFDTTMGMNDLIKKLINAYALAKPSFTNQVISKPTKFNHGAGLMGEAGPEAIMPLKRSKSGALGVEVNGASSPSVNITIINNTSATISKSVDNDGNITLTIEDVVSRVSNDNDGNIPFTIEDVVSRVSNDIANHEGTIHSALRSEYKPRDIY